MESAEAIAACEFLSAKQGEAVMLRSHAAYTATRGGGRPLLLNAAGRGDLEGIRAALREGPGAEAVRAATELAIEQMGEGGSQCVLELLRVPLTPLAHYVEHFFHMVSVGCFTPLRLLAAHAQGEYHLSTRFAPWADFPAREDLPLSGWVAIACARKKGLERLTLRTADNLVRALPEAVLRENPALVARSLELMGELDEEDEEAAEAFEALLTAPAIVAALRAADPGSALRRNPRVEAVIGRG
jgi:hypothetical protein